MRRLEQINVFHVPVKRCLDLAMASTHTPPRIESSEKKRMVDSIDCAVIGAGVVGLAVARELALAGREVIVLEQADAIGTVTSSRNSEVIHAGLYYPKDSLKARLCMKGRALLYAYLQERGIDHARCGKLIIASGEEEIAALQALEEKARGNGVGGLAWLSGADARAMEPLLVCEKALWSPDTGIFDSHAYMLNLQGDAENHGAVFSFLSRVLGGRVLGGGTELEIRTEAGDMSLIAKTVVNAAGHGAQPIAKAIQGVPPETVPPQYFAKGNYFYLAGKAPFERLIYPVPGEASLGLHYTRDLGGQGRFGPDVEWVESLEYAVDAARAQSFYAAIRRYWPDLPDGTLTPGYSGIRPKIQAPGEAAHDFVIQGSSRHGVDGLVCLYGIESPGLTASLAIAREVAAHL